ncbi:hypothetical protein BKA70DRAFT_1447794 [Coprinopsis sp. MPI-PUGE-AT-0042]|nr:hypothetical protein BKA70DRAFT_1447794 [Coprinopsis sp. MPI-PUGE-AT-0042]
MPRAVQISSRTHPTVHSFLKRIQAAHRAMASRGFMRQVFHYSASTKKLEPWFWPVYDGEGNPERGTCRVEPSGLEEYRRYHELQAPSCLCALIDRVPYTETRIGLVESGERRGAYAAECAEKRCGYIVYLDDFYTALGLRVRKYVCRETPLEINEAVEKDSEDTVQGHTVGHGLLEAIAQLLHSDFGVDEQEFRRNVQQCDQCRRLVRRQTKHRCRGQRWVVAQLSEQWGRGNVIDLTRED